MTKLLILHLWLMVVRVKNHRPRSHRWVASILNVVILAIQMVIDYHRTVAHEPRVKSLSLYTHFFVIIAAALVFSFREI